MRAFETKQKPALSPKPATDRAAIQQQISDTIPEMNPVRAACACGGGCPRCQNGGGATFIQRKPLEISSPADADEIEADEVARKVVDGQPAEIRETGSAINRSGEGRAEAAPGFRSKLDGSRGGGHSLDGPVRREMESKMGADLSGVKIHTGGEAHKMNEDVSARAFTHGQDIFFRQGEFNPGSRQGKELLAHELAHTAQQGKSLRKKIQRQTAPQTLWEDDKSSKDAPLYYNTEAEANARKAALEKRGNWEEYTVKSFKEKGKTYWRVQFRGRRTISNFLTMLRKAEKAYPSWSNEQMVNSLRRLAGYDTENFQKLYGTSAAADLSPMPLADFSEADIQQLRDMLVHDETDKGETGIVKDFVGEYLAMGHVLTGISGGLHRKKYADLGKSYLPAGEKMDNLYAATLTGDLGQSATFVNDNKQRGYIGPGTEATEAELVGDIDGIILGKELTLTQKNWAAAASLSDFIENYYRSASPKARFNSAANFNDAYVKDQITRFAETYSYKDSKVGGLFSKVGTESAEAYEAYQKWLAKKNLEEAKKYAAPIKP